MKAAIMAVSALICMTGCNRESKQAARDNAAAAKENVAESREAIRDSSAAAMNSNKTMGEKETMGEKAKEDARETGKDISNGAATAANKAKDMTNKAGEKVEGVFLEDKGLTKTDAVTNEKIRAALKKNKDVAREASDIHIVTENGAVSLHGTVTSATIRDEVIRIAGSVAGKTKVGNDIKVAERVGAGPDER